MRYDARFEPLEPAIPAMALASLFTTQPALFAEISIPLPQEDAA
ncbi:MAG TPA: hypothetical protein QF469_12470 [Sphingomonas sanguinis]|nr:hypothetical protein [Sphingomonas sanguinis]